MTYDNFLGWSQFLSLLIFGAVMMGVLLHALRPSNRHRFEQAARLPLLIDEDGEAGRANLSLTVWEEREPHGRA